MLMLTVVSDASGNHQLASSFNTPNVITNAYDIQTRPLQKMIYIFHVNILRKMKKIFNNFRNVGWWYKNFTFRIFNK